MSSINNTMFPFINKLLITFFPDKEEKDKRINALIERIEKLFSKITTNKTTIGSFILIIHWIGLLFVYGLGLFGKVNALNITILAMMFTFPIPINLYYGGLRHYGCILTRLERHFFNDYNWKGPFVCMNLFLRSFKSPSTQFYSELSGIVISILLAFFIVYKIYYKMKSGKDIDLFNHIKHQM